MNNEKRKRFLQRIRVPLGFILAVALIVLSRPTPLSLIVGSIIAVAGILIRAWSAGHIRKYEKLAVTGPYSFTRNPLYLGSFFLAAGFAVAAGVWWLTVIVAVLYLSIYFPVMNVEADVLEQRLGEEYRDYAKNVPLLIPRLTPWKKTGRRFDFQLYLKNGEYNAAIGLVVASTILVLKSYLF